MGTRKPTFRRFRVTKLVDDEDQLKLGEFLAIPGFIFLPINPVLTNCLSKYLGKKKKFASRYGIRCPSVFENLFSWMMKEQNE